MIVAMAQSTAGQMLDVLSRAGKERTAMGKALFLAERALAVATIIINTEKGASVATSMGPFGIPMATYIRATGYASAGLVAGMAVADSFGGGRAYGGGVSGASLYKVGEKGPEIYAANNGDRYMLPGRSGTVIPNDQIGGESSVIDLRIINQNPTAQVSQRQGADGRPELVIGEVARQIRENDGPVWQAMRSATNVQGRL
jgi:hypothetical protein